MVLGGRYVRVEWPWRIIHRLVSTIFNRWAVILLKHRVGSLGGSNSVLWICRTCQNSTPINLQSKEAHCRRSRVTLKIRRVCDLGKRETWDTKKGYSQIVLSHVTNNCLSPSSLIWIKGISKTSGYLFSFLDIFSSCIGTLLMILWVYVQAREGLN